MPITVRVPVLLCALVLSAAAARPQAQSPWNVLFDGTSLAAFRGYKAETMPPGWSIVGGTLTKADKAGDIISREQFGDFELELEWKDRHPREAHREQHRGSARAGVGP